MLTEETLRNLDKDELIKLVLEYAQLDSKIDGITEKIDCYQQLRKDFDEYKKSSEESIENLKEEVAEMKTEMSVLSQSNKLLNEDVKMKNSKIQSIERDLHQSREYQHYETLEISPIPISIPQKDIKRLSIKILNSVCDSGYKILPLDTHAIHRRGGEFTKEKVLVKFVCRDQGDHFLHKKKIPLDKLTEIDDRFKKPVYINEALGYYLNKLRYGCKRLYTAGLISAYDVDHHKLWVWISEEDEAIQITHKADLIKILTEKQGEFNLLDHMD